MSKTGNPAATYTNEKPLDKYRDAEERLTRTHRTVIGSTVEWSLHQPTGSSCHASTLIVTVWTDLKQQLHTAGISSASNSPSCPVSAREGSVSVFNCGAPSALRMVDALEAARLTVNPLETSPAKSKIPRDGA